MLPKRSRKARQRSGQNTGQIHWAREDEVDLLAWLVYTLERDASGNLFRNTVLDHFKRTQRERYNIAQVDQRLKKFWADFCPRNHTDPEEIYRFGTKNLVGMEPELRKDVLARVESFRYEALFILAHADRQLRSNSFNSSSAALDHLRVGAEVVKSHSPRKRRCKGLSDEECVDQDSLRRVEELSNPFTAGHQSEHIGEGAISKQELTLEVIPDSDEHNTDGEDDGISVTEAFSKRQRPPISSTFFLTDIERQSHTPGAESFSSTSIDHCRPIEDTNTSFSSTQRNSKQEHLDCETLRAQISIRETEHSAELEYYQDRLKKAENLGQDLKRQLSCLESAYRMMSKATDETIRKRLCDQEVHISDLQAQLKDKKWLRPFSKLGSSDIVAFDGDEIQEGMSSINNLIKEVSIDLGDYQVMDLVALAGKSDLLSLLSHSFGRESFQTTELSSYASASSFQALVRALLATAVCQWVFESEIPELSIRPCPLLKKYRSHLLTQDGRTTLRNLDFAAHKRIIQEESFQKHVIPARSKKLAVQLLRSLAPLFESSGSLKPQTPESLGFLSEQASTLVEIFQHALKIKAESIVSSYVFEAVLYSPGTLFDSATMEAENLPGERPDTSSLKHSVVSFCLLPAILTYVSDRTLVEFNNFVPSGSQQRTDRSTLSKAIVILEV